MDSSKDKAIVGEKIKPGFSMSLLNIKKSGQVDVEGKGCEAAIRAYRRNKKNTSSEVSGRPSFKNRNAITPRETTPRKAAFREEEPSFKRGATPRRFVASRDETLTKDETPEKAEDCVVEMQEEELSENEYMSYANQEFDSSEIMDEQVDAVINTLIDQVKRQAIYTFNKSIGFKLMDKLIFLLLIGLGISIGVLGMRESESNKFVAGILGFIVTAFVGIKEEFKFRDRSRVLRDCCYKFNKYAHELRILSFSSKEPIEILERVKEIETRLNRVDMNAFDSKVITIAGDYSSFGQPKPPQVVAPGEIPQLVT